MRTVTHLVPAPPVKDSAPGLSSDKRNTCGPLSPRNLASGFVKHTTASSVCTHPSGLSSLVKPCHLLVTGCSITKPELIHKLEQGEGPWESPGRSLSGELMSRRRKRAEPGWPGQGSLPLNVSVAELVECWPSRCRAPALIPSRA